MKINNATLKVAAVAGLTAVLIVGCSTPTIPVTMNVSGEVKLNGVSKIALADFNSLKGDAFTGVKAADKETCALVKRAVASAFYASPMYKIVDLDIEKDIHDATGAKPGKRFDAVIYGRLWWQVMPETKGQYPRMYTLTSWKKVPYKQVLPNKKEVPAVAVLTSLQKDVLKMLEYRTRNATLMLTLSIYRLENSGDIVKIVDTYQVSNQGFTLMNGEIKLEAGSIGIKDDSAVARLQKTGDKEKVTTAYEDMFVTKSTVLGEVGKTFAGAGAAQASGLASSATSTLGALGGLGGGLGGGLLGGKKEEPKAEKKAEKKKDDKKAAAGRKVDANGMLILTQETVSMPTELQAKLMLASSVSRSLSAKLAPSKATFNVSADFGDTRLENLIKNGAFKSAKAYSMYTVRQKIGKQICAKLANFLPEFGEECSYPIPDSEEKIEGDDKLLSYLAVEDLDNYFYALGICSEAAQDLDVAQEYYRFAFKVNPCMDYALGISRVYLAMGESARLQQTKKAKNKAEKKTQLD